MRRVFFAIELRSETQQSMIQSTVESIGVGAKCYFIKGIGELSYSLTQAQDDSVLILNEHFERLWNPEMVQRIMKAQPSLRIVLTFNHVREEIQEETIVRFIELGVNDFLFDNDASIENIASLISLGRTQSEAYSYAGISMNLSKVQAVDVPRKASEGGKAKKISWKNVTIPQPREIKQGLSERRVVGICGLTHGEGTTSVALSMATKLSEGADGAAFMELPYERSTNVYDSIGSSFTNYVSHIHCIVNRENVTRVNHRGNLEFYAQSTERPLIAAQQITENVIRQYIGLTQKTTVVDLGMNLTRVAPCGILNLLTDLIIITNAERLDERLDRFSRALGTANEYQLNPVILLVGEKRELPKLANYRVYYIKDDFDCTKIIEELELDRVVCKVMEKKVVAEEPPRAADVEIYKETKIEPDTSMMETRVPTPVEVAEVEEVPQPEAPRRTVEEKMKTEPPRPVVKKPSKPQPVRKKPEERPIVTEQKEEVERILRKRETAKGIPVAVVAIGVSFLIIAVVFLLYVMNGKLQDVTAERNTLQTYVNGATQNVLVAVTDLKAGDVVTAEDFISLKILSSPKLNYVSGIEGEIELRTDMEAGQPLIANNLLLEKAEEATPTPTITPTQEDEDETAQ